MKVEIDGREVRLEFYHWIPGTNGTECCIVTGYDDDLVLLGTGTTVLHKNDLSSYDKEFGRKLSLTRALRDAGFNKVERTLVWEAYRNR